MQHLIDVGRVYHTHNKSRSSPLYSKVLETSACDVLISASGAGDQILFELNAYEISRTRKHDDSRADKLTRLNAEYGWWGGYERGCKRMRGFHSRGTPGPAFFPDGRVYDSWPSWKESFQCWKDGRVYQAHGRIAGEAQLPLIGAGY